MTPQATELTPRRARSDTSGDKNSHLGGQEVTPRGVGQASRYWNNGVGERHQERSEEAEHEEATDEVEGVAEDGS